MSAMLFQLELAFWAFKGSPIRLVRTCFTPGVSDGIVPPVIDMLFIRWIRQI